MLFIVIFKVSRIMENNILKWLFIKWFYNSVAEWKIYNYILSIATQYYDKILLKLLTKKHGKSN